MDVSPKTLREVEFREKMRGYHPEDVDQFLERVAAGIEVLQDRLRQAIERAQRAEQAASEAGNNDEALRRTLLLAQRTADLAVQEAREQAARIVAGAEQQAQGMIAEAEHRARQGHEDTVIEVRTELTKLQARRQELELDVATLAVWIEGHRAQLRAALDDALARVDQIDLSDPPAAPDPSRAFSPADQPSPYRAPAAAEPQPSYATVGPGPGIDQSATASWSPPPEVEISPGHGEDGDADPYFAELRRAVAQTDPPGPRDDDGPQPHTTGSEPPGDELYSPDHAGSRRFGDRLRRRL